MVSGPLVLTPGAALGKSDDVVVPEPIKSEGKWPSSVDAVPIPFIDTGVFVTELMNQEILPKKFAGGLTDDEKAAARANPDTLLDKARAPENRHESLEQGTYRGTRMALTKAYDLIESKYASFMDVANFEPTVPSKLSLEQKKGYFVFTNPASDQCPPHLNMLANAPIAGQGPEIQSSKLPVIDIFNAMRLAQLTTLIPTILPKGFVGDFASAAATAAAWVEFGGMGTPDKGKRLSDVEDYNRAQTRRWYHKDIFDLPNIGDLEDWYSDARFAQQHFTGTNPTTIEQAGKWVQIFIDAASDSDPIEKAMKTKISQRASSSPGSLYVQDYSYIREAAGYTDPKAEMSSVVEQDKSQRRWGVASVCLFNLADNGKLEPLAIIVDWLGSVKDSVFVYNRELSVTEQRTDWPWRYAKTCVMNSDWIRHNISVHLCRTHLVEEAIIVAVNRTIPQDHDVFQLLYPHWQKTLSLNAAARSTLLPHVIVPLMGVPEKEVYTFLRYEYDNYDFKSSYIPEDLRRRGFDPEKLDDPKYHNYAWARCIHSMWHKIRAYVKDVLSLRYSDPNADAQVRADEYVQSWVREMRRSGYGAKDDKDDKDGLNYQGGAGLSSFPDIQTLDDLVDAVTMCIHIASPQHTSVNYLQNFYQAFVVNKPPALFKAPPKTADELKRYNEDDLVAALPMNHTHDWLLASHVPYLLSFKPGEKESLIIYAASKYHVYKYKTSEKEQGIARAAANFYKALARSEEEFKAYGKEVDDHDTIVYNVLSPSWNAVSILI